MSDGNQISYLEMSDEELANIDPSTIGLAAPIQEETSEEEETNTEGVGTTATEGEGEGEGTETEVAPQGQTEGDGAEQSNEGTEQASSNEEEEGTTTEEITSSTETSTEPKIDYEAEYKRLTAPFKANGREIQVKSVDDAVSLMQMGANYNKKMAALKPNLRLMKMLENNGLLSEEKLSYLIDLEKKNPEAINKLIKDSGLDPLDLDTSKAGDYKPTVRKVDDREIELDTVLEEIQDSPTYTRTLTIVSNEWDAASKQVVADSPQLLKVIDTHVKTGIYDLISKEIEHERLFGRLNGLSDIEAYRQVGDMIQARGGFDHLQKQGQQTTEKPVIVQPKPKMGDEDKRREKRLAASSSKAVTPSKSSAEFNPLALSDDEFNKIVNKQFL